MAKIDRPTCPLSMLSMSSTDGGASEINNTPWSRPSNCMVSQREAVLTALAGAVVRHDLHEKCRRGDHGSMQQNRVEPRPLIVVATTLPFFARAATIVQETWRELDRMAAALDQCAVALSADNAERAIFELLTGGMRELARRLEQTEVALSACLPTP
jgi:hypothetical protein